MTYEIDESIAKRAFLCPRDQVCLTGKGGLYCRVEVLMRGTDEEVPLVDCLKEVKCPYLKSFGSTFICGCPVRREIFKRYGK